MEIQKFEYVKNEKSFLDEMKNTLKDYHLVKNRSLIKDSRHKLEVCGRNQLPLS